MKTQEIINGLCELLLKQEAGADPLPLKMRSVNTSEWLSSFRAKEKEMKEAQRLTELDRNQEYHRRVAYQYILKLLLDIQPAVKKWPDDCKLLIQPVYDAIHSERGEVLELFQKELKTHKSKFCRNPTKRKA